MEKEIKERERKGGKEKKMEIVERVNGGRTEKKGRKDDGERKEENK